MSQNEINAILTEPTLTDDEKKEKIKALKGETGKKGLFNKKK